MAVRRTKSYLDHLVGANRGRNKHIRRKPVQHLPPEQQEGVLTSAAVAAGADYPEEEVEVDHQPVGDPPPEIQIPVNPAEDESDYNPKTALDELVRAPVQKTVAVVQARKSTGPSPSSFRRPPNAPVARTIQSADDRIIVTLPAPVLEKYKARWKNPHQSFAEFIAQTLARFADYSDDKPLYINDRMRRKIEAFAHRDFSSAEEFIGWLLSSGEVLACNETLDVEPYLIQRAKDRQPPELTFGQYLTELLTFGIEERTGVR